MPQVPTLDNARPIPILPGGGRLEDIAKAIKDAERKKLPVWYPRSVRKGLAFLGYKKVKV